MRLSDYKGEDALDLLADILGPATEILSDDNIKKAFKDGVSRIDLVKMLLKSHKKEIIEIMATVDGEDPNTYKVNVFTLPIKLLDIVGNEEFLQLFQLQGQETVEESSGSATESTEEKGK